MKKPLWIALALLWTACTMPNTRSATPVVPAKKVSAREQQMAPRAIVATPPPPVRIEGARPPSPGGNAIWRAGSYLFRDGRYVWVRGAWVVPPRPDLTWVPGFFKRTSEGGVFINGHWRPG